MANAHCDPKRRWDREAVNVLLLSVISILVSLQVLAIIVAAFQHVPLSSKLTLTFFQDWISGVRPERESLFYRIFIILVFSFQAGSVYKFREQLPRPDFTGRLARFLGVELLWVSLLCFSIFKRVVREEDGAFRILFYSSLALACLSKIFCRQIDGRVSSNIPDRCSDRRGQDSSGDQGSGRVMDRKWIVAFDFLIFAFIVLAVFIPERQGVIAQIFGQDMFHHFDTFVAAPAWAFIKGNTLDVDSYSQYGFGMPVVVGFLSKMIGTVNYENMLLVLLVLAITYLILGYTFLRLWFKHIGLAFLGIVLILKFQMFNNSTADPIIWRYPSTTVVRYFFDIPFFILVLWHLKKPSSGYLVAAGIICGVAIYYLTDSGVYLAVTYCAYVILLLTLPATRSFYWQKHHGLKDVLGHVGYGVLPLATSFFLFWLFVGQHIFGATFWDHFMDFVYLFKGGWGAIPIGDFAAQGKFLNFFAGLAMCLVYVFTVIFVGVMCFREKWDRQNLLAVVIGIYGLAIFHYYIARSSADSIPVVCIPCLLLLCYWLNIAGGYLKPSQRRYVLLVLGVWSILGLGTTRAFLQYPNSLNLSGKSFATEKQKMHAQLFSAGDIDLIRRLTEANEKVCLIGSLETAILMEADRRPFLYYFPFLFSRAFKMRDFGGTVLFNRQRLEKTLADFEDEKPRYVFIEKKFMGGLPPLYYARFEVLRIIVAYLQEKYEPSDLGEYLVALKRRD